MIVCARVCSGLCVCPVHEYTRLSSRQYTNILDGVYASLVRACS